MRTSELVPAKGGYRHTPMRRSSALLISAMVLAGCTPAEQPATGTPAVAQVSYEIFPTTVQFGDTPEALLRNTGNVPLEYHHAFLLETFETGAWRKIQTTDDPEYTCDLPSTGLVLHPGDSKNQRITACDLHGQVQALPAGRYRVTKAVLTVPDDPQEDPTELEKVVEFEVEPAPADIPGPADCDVLCISETHVERGEIVRVSFAPQKRFIWGALSHLHKGTEETIEPIAFLIAYGDRDDEILTSWPGDGGGVNDIGFTGSSEWDWVIPRRLRPGVYSIVHQGITQGNEPVEKRITKWTVSFEVLP